MLSKCFAGGAGSLGAWLVAWAGVALPSPAARAAPDAQELLERVRLHDQQLEAVAVEYDIRQTFEISGAPPAGAERAAKAALPTVPKSQTIEGRFVRDGQKYRGDRTTTVVAPDGRQNVQRVEAAFDGEVVRQYEPHRKAGIISPPNERDSRLLQELQPLHWGWSYGAQPLGDFLGAGKMTVVGDEALGGVDTTVVDFTSQHGQRFKLWIVPAWGYRFKKLEKYDAAGKVMMTFDAELAERDGVWFPSRGQWRLVNWQSGNLPPVTQSATLEVKSVKVNQAVAPEEFAVQFPAGTLVIDQILNTGYRVNGNLVDPTGTDPVARLDAARGSNPAAATTSPAGASPPPGGATAAASAKSEAPAPASPAVTGSGRTGWPVLAAASAVAVGALGVATWRLAARRRHPAA